MERAILGKFPNASLINWAANFLFVGLDVFSFFWGAFLRFALENFFRKGVPSCALQWKTFLGKAFCPALCGGNFFRKDVPFCVLRWKFSAYRFFMKYWQFCSRKHCRLHFFGGSFACFIFSGKYWLRRLSLMLTSFFDD